MDQIKSGVILQIPGAHFTDLFALPYLAKEEKAFLYLPEPWSYQPLVNQANTLTSFRPPSSVIRDLKYIVSSQLFGQNMGF